MYSNSSDINMAMEHEWHRSGAEGSEVRRELMLFFNMGVTQGWLG